MKTVQYSSQRRGTPNLHLLSHPLTLRRCNLSNESNCIVCRDAPLEFLNLPWCPSTVTGIAVVPSLTQTFPRQELQSPMTNEIRPLDQSCIIKKMWNVILLKLVKAGFHPDFSTGGSSISATVQPPTLHEVGGGGNYASTCGAPGLCYNSSWL